MNNRTIIFTDTVDGHVLEYLYHLYCNINLSNDLYYFLLPIDFKEKQKYLHWPNKENVHFIFLDESEKQRCNSVPLIRRCYEINKIVRKYIKQLDATDITFINLMLAMPFLPFFIPHNIRVKGIVYRIFLYENSRSILYTWRNVITFYLFGHLKCFNKIFLLNDTSAVKFFNNKFCVRKFRFLPDPIPDIRHDEVHDLRNSLNIPFCNKVYLQFGTLDERKNTLTILKAIELMSDDDLKTRTFIFSGRLSLNIENQFYELVNRLSSRTQIIVMEGFVPYEKLNELCKTSDYILTLYTNVSQSSGSIGYAATFNKVVIGSSKGLLGNLIKEYNLGVTISDITPENIKNAFLNTVSPCSDETYVLTHRVEDFCKTILYN